MSSTNERMNNVSNVSSDNNSLNELNTLYKSNINDKVKIDALHEASKKTWKFIKKIKNESNEFNQRNEIFLEIRRLHYYLYETINIIKSLDDKETNKKLMLALNNELALKSDKFGYLMGKLDTKEYLNIYDVENSFSEIFDGFNEESNSDTESIGSSDSINSLNSNLSLDIKDIKYLREDSSECLFNSDSDNELNTFDNQKEIETELTETVNKVDKMDKIGKIDSMNDAIQSNEVGLAN